MTTLIRTTMTALICCAALPALAMEKIDTRDQFMTELGDRELTIGLYGLSLAVTGDGQINGRAIGTPVTGDWTWQDGYFCREMQWGSMDIPYNCQLVEVQGDKMRFTVDRGAGRSASFRLR